MKKQKFDFVEACNNVKKTKTLLVSNNFHTNESGSFRKRGTPSQERKFNKKLNKALLKELNRK